MENFDALKQWWIYGLSAIGGIVGYGQDFKLDDTWKIHVLKFTFRLMTALFAGMMAYTLSTAIGLPKVWSFLMVGIFAWRGARGLQAISDYLDKKLGSDVPPTAK